ncbi:MAG: glycine cleavage system aminomethyltransferase GcvT [Microscillaceae bacterium]|nr:glycine cleavage system aminomethyltransferase GcvT [Microscillaceae bacterium]MDW8461700.1 glycine cleavage system aminomethyltransferase GcvT [Cytophagales bacterium]
MSLKHIPLNDLHIALGAKMVDFAGFYMPLRYTSEREEHLAVRQSVGIFDVSHMGEFFIKGEKALDLLQYVVSNDVATLPVGKAQYAYMPNDVGGIVDDLLIYHLAEKEYMMVVNAANIDKDWQWINHYNTFGAELENASDKICLFAVQGPKAAETLQKLTSYNLIEMPYYAVRRIPLAGLENVIVASTGYTKKGSGSFEVFVPNEYAREVWEKIFEAGKEFNIKPAGLGARDTLRLEMGYCLYGNEINDYTSPFEANLGWVTKFTKKFVNSENLLKAKEQGVKRKLVALEMIEKGIPRSHYEIYSLNQERIGEVTSGSISPVLNVGICLGYVPKEFAEIDTQVYIKIRDSFAKAKVVKLPFVK